jgi:ubiquinone/menaquinone biosynthesis C-methylase UbiE
MEDACSRREGVAQGWLEARGPSRMPSRMSASDSSSMSEAAGAGRYLLGDTAAELQHLVAQAEVYAAEAEQLLGDLSLPSGARAIDVGCGVLGIVHLLRARVGDSGHVVGVDREPRILEMARGLAEQRRIEVEFVQADATATGLPRASFDLVHARTLLLNVSNPDEVVAEMVALARPGGVVAVQEPDSSGWVCDPPHPAWPVLRAAVTDAYRANGKDFDIGRRSGRLLRGAGLEEVRVRATARVTRPGEYYQTFLLTLAQLVREDILAAHVLTADELDSYIDSLRAHLAAPGTLTSQPLMWQAWGRTPR